MVFVSASFYVLYELTGARSIFFMSHTGYVVAGMLFCYMKASSGV